MSQHGKGTAAVASERQPAAPTNALPRKGPTTGDRSGEHQDSVPEPASPMARERGAPGTAARPRAGEDPGRSRSVQLRGHHGHRREDPEAASATPNATDPAGATSVASRPNTDRAGRDRRTERQQQRAVRVGVAPDHGQSRSIRLAAFLVRAGVPNHHG